MCDIRTHAEFKVSNTHIYPVLHPVHGEHAVFLFTKPHDKWNEQLTSTSRPEHQLQKILSKRVVDAVHITGCIKPEQRNP